MCQCLLLRVSCVYKLWEFSHGPFAHWKIPSDIKVSQWCNWTSRLDLTLVNSIIWALILGCHAATQSFTGLFIARFFLGAAEASISPGFSLITGMWYKRQEQPFRHGIWFFGNSVAVMFGSLLGYAIAHIRGSLAAWRVSQPSLLLWQLF